MLIRHRFGTSTTSTSIIHSLISRSRDNFGARSPLVFASVVGMNTKKKAVLVGLVVGCLLTALATVSSNALASGGDDSSPGSTNRTGSTMGSDTSDSPDSTTETTDPSVIASSPITTGPTGGSTPGYPPGFDVVVERINTSGAPDAVKERILDRIEILKESAVASPPSLGALGALLGRTIAESPLRDQVRDQLRLRVQDFDRLIQSSDDDGAREQIRQIVDRYREEMLRLVQERVHTRLEGIIARLPELAGRIDSEAWREDLTGLRNELLAATDLAELRAVVVEVRAALADLRRDIRES